MHPNEAQGSRVSVIRGLVRMGSLRSPKRAWLESLASDRRRRQPTCANMAWKTGQIRGSGIRAPSSLWLPGLKTLLRMMGSFIPASKNSLSPFQRQYRKGAFVSVLARHLGCLSPSSAQVTRPGEIPRRVPWPSVVSRRPHPRRHGDGGIRSKAQKDELFISFSHDCWNVKYHFANMPDEKMNSFAPILHKPRQRIVPWILIRNYGGTRSTCEFCYWARL